jgi:hypothetical protein
MLQALKVPEIPRPAPQPLPIPHLEPPLVYVPPTWEYHHVQKTAGQSLNEQQLNALGAEGWELVDCRRLEVTSGDHRVGAHAFYERLGY